MLLATQDNENGATNKTLPFNLDCEPLADGVACDFKLLGTWLEFLLTPYCLVCSDCGACNLRISECVIGSKTNFLP